MRHTRALLTRFNPFILLLFLLLLAVYCFLGEMLPVHVPEPDPLDPLDLRDLRYRPTDPEIFCTDPVLDRDPFFLL
jgi:hypothetical protein